MGRFGLLALSFLSLGAGGCAGLFGAAPASFAYSMGQGQIVFQLPLAIVVEEVDRAFTEAGFQVTFRHVDRQTAIVKAKTKDGKTVEASLKVDGMLTQLSLKVGRWGDREQTEALITNVKKGTRNPGMKADTAADAITDAAPAKKADDGLTAPVRTASGRVRGPADPPPK